MIPRPAILFLSLVATLAVFRVISSRSRQHGVELLYVPNAAADPSYVRSYPGFSSYKDGTSNPYGDLTVKEVHTVSPECRSRDHLEFLCQKRNECENVRIACWWYAHMYDCTYIFLYVCIHAYICMVYVHLCLCVLVCLACTWLYACACILYACMFLYACIQHTCMWFYTIHTALLICMHVFMFVYVYFLGGCIIHDKDLDDDEWKY
jgi:hypothetical protein